MAAASARVKVESLSSHYPGVVEVQHLFRQLLDVILGPGVGEVGDVVELGGEHVRRRGVEGLYEVPPVGGLVRLAGAKDERAGKPLFFQVADGVPVPVPRQGPTVGLEQVAHQVVDGLPVLRRAVRGGV